MPKKTDVLDDIKSIEKRIHEVVENLSKADKEQLAKDVCKADTQEERRRFFKKVMRQKLMPADVFPSADFMGKNCKSVFTVYVRRKGENIIYRRDGYFIYECGVSFWQLVDQDEFKEGWYEILAWERHIYD